MASERRYFCAFAVLLGGPLVAGACSFNPSTIANSGDGGVADLMDADRPDASLSTGACLEAPYELRPGSTQRYFLQTMKMDYDHAQATCMEAGATLVVINDLDENKYIRDLGGVNPWMDPWIGFNDMDFEGEENYAWVTGDSFNFTHWNDGEPNDINGEDCATLEDGGWDDRPCGDLRESVCECEPERLVAPAPDCMTNEAYVSKYESRRYRLETMAANYKDAMASCVADGAHLVVISDERENQFVESLSPDASKWIGLNDAATENSFAWVTGSVCTFDKWAGLQPDDNLGNEDCVEMYSDTFWNDATCTLEKQFVCECDPTYRAPSVGLF